MDLPVIESCDGCGACCMEQESPPGYVMLIAQPQLGKGKRNQFRDDVKRLKHLPKAARQELDEHIAHVQANPRHGAAQPCIWLDQATMRCRWYEHRPSICRDGLQLGDDGCRSWRLAYGKASEDERHEAIAAPLRRAFVKEPKR